MRKFLIPGILTVFSLFLPVRSQGAPIDVPYQILATTFTNTGSVVFSTTNFPSPNATVNSLAASYQWCLDRLTVSCASNDSVTIYYATSTISAGTTNYAVTVDAAIPFDADLGYREPYCSPVGFPVVTIQSSVAASTITAEGYLFKGWNP